MASLAELRWKIRKAEQAAAALTDSTGLVDYGIDLRVVKQSPRGSELVPGSPPLEVIRSHKLGGMVDVRIRRVVGPSKRRRIWYCGEAHEELILHDRDRLPDKIFIEGAEGSGKTMGVLGFWLILRAYEFCETGLLVDGAKYIGATAPTGARLDRIWEALYAACDPAWYSDPVRQTKVFPLRLGITFQLVSTHVRSKAEGSSVQGYNWLAHAGDEGQDQMHVEPDIEARGRTAPEGRYRRCVTASVKDWSAYREYRDAKRANDLWLVRRIIGPENPFVHPEHWERMKRLGRREYDRRVMALDVRGERATYPDFTRATHVVADNRFAKDVTVKVLDVYQSYAKPGASFVLLAGHDPGILYNTTVLLRARLARDKSGKALLSWYACGEFVTNRTTQDQHAAQFKRYLQDRFQVQYDPDPRDVDTGQERVLVICDPHGNGEKRPDQDEYWAFRKHGFDIYSASPSGAPIKRKNRIEVVNGLLRNSRGETRLWFEALEDGSPATPTLVTSLEDAHLDEYGTPENVKKDVTDSTHAGTALGFALWPFERENYSEYTHKRAIAREKR